jgi:hypothetical protein
MLWANVARSRSFDSVEGHFAQDDSSFGDMNFRLRTLMKRDEKCKPDGEGEQGDKEVTVGENGFCLGGNFHGCRDAFCMAFWVERKPS